MAPAVRPAAGSSKDCLRHYLSASFQEPLGDAALVAVDGTPLPLRPTVRCKAAEFSRRIHRRTGGQRHRERSCGLGSACRGAGRHLRLGSGPRERRARGGSSCDGKRRTRAGIEVGGDTKVVEHGKADGMYITTAGIGRPLPGVIVMLARSRRRQSCSQGRWRPRNHDSLGPWGAGS